MEEIVSPRVVPRSQHPISRNDIDPDALRVLYRLHHRGFKAYLVGGCVRDLLLGKTPKDFDVATDAHPREVREMFRNSRLIGRRFRLAHVFFPGGKNIEVSTFRSRSEFDPADPGNGMKPDNDFGTPEEDASRRDITINGIFYDISDFSLVDYVGGLEDLREGWIRCIGDPEEKFVQDPVRMIRVIRHAARTGFRIEEATYRSLLTHVEKIRLCSPARVRDEFFRELREGLARNSIRLMIETGMLFALFPSFHAPLEEEKNRESFLRHAGIMDGLPVSDGVPGEEIYLALFLIPLLEYFCPSPDLPPGRRGQADFLGRVRNWLLDLLGPLHFTRYSKETTAQILGAQRMFQELLPHGKIPPRLMRRPYIRSALHLFQLALQARGEDAGGFSWSVEEKPFFRRKRKLRHRRRRPNRHRPEAPPAQPGEPRP